MKKIILILFFIGISLNVYAAKDFARRYPNDTAMEVYTPNSANLSSLVALPYVSPSFVKMTGINTFTLDTNTYYKSGDSPSFGTIILNSLYRVSGMLDKGFTIIRPDLVYTNGTSTVMVMHVDPDTYPYGIKLINVQFTLQTDAAYTLVYKEYSSAMVLVSTIESLSTTASQLYAESRTTDIDDSNIAADNYIIAVLPSTNVPQVHGEVIFYAKGS